MKKPDKIRPNLKAKFNQLSLKSQVVLISSRNLRLLLIIGAVMQNMKLAEIYGNLKYKVIINRVNHQYGIIFITVEHKRDVDHSIWRGIYKSNCIPVFIWGQDMLDKLAHISDDEKIWAVGKLELLDNSLLKEVGYYINPNDLEESGNVVISVRDKNRIRTISKDETHASWLSISSKI